MTLSRFWTDLRVHESPALIKALELGPVELYPVWCWDPYYIYNTPVGPNRWQFLLSMTVQNYSSLEVNP
ncbi:cryptochrome [Puccinia graminis f. sp. tritici CRL 75-36-700-3]|uniref:Cryptochrome n=1 Tax=Puccinia graminis f. sp. tritici (strain CRL 75-36-700-3 / race SCCL) TaxID=418459 RepID=E3KV24_PUCGT|nr:cryptochrome [Puccinia graminis f. sp. tritici CRL 75-36-700-3]EFP88124.1 cryptochrome [Puccinia graminis f. sp. tritici CRL 75-36-700-3]